MGVSSRREHQRSLVRIGRPNMEDSGAGFADSNGNPKLEDLGVGCCDNSDSPKLAFQGVVLLARVLR